ncbi:MAG: UDP-glucose/GDP-mannose dehydrogenase family protein [Armatimonadetes bacterium]|nr:UDP-glucose/GDP-mannose dehydrogenase family protein [Armatimonadota bacterium]
MRVSVFGLGYVGAVSAACFAKGGHTVVGVDPDPRKTELISSGKSPIVEADLERYLQEGVESGRLTTTGDVATAVRETDLSLICVGTPSRENGDLKTDYIKRVCEEIGTALRDKSDYHLVVIRSTILPGTAHNVALPALESSSGKKAGVDFGLAVNPEFLREGTAIADFYQPPFTVIGASRREDGARIAELYNGVDAAVEIVDIRTAEMIKYSCNAYHALKITFANEIGMICKAEGIDSHEVMRVFCMDEKLNISSKYLLPGFAFGGSCLPKDVRALTYRALSRDVETPMMTAMLQSNKVQVERVFKTVQNMNKRRIGLFGLSFKPGTDDLRESPLVELAEKLYGKGYQLKIYDANVHYASLYGANKAFIDAELPHLATILYNDPAPVIEDAEVLIIGHSDGKLDSMADAIRPDQIVLDLARSLNGEKIRGEYVGLYW